MSDWLTQAACRDDADADLWFAPETQTYAAAISLDPKNRRRNQHNLARVIQGREPLAPGRSTRAPDEPRMTDRAACHKGHPLTPENRSGYDGRCKTCQRESGARKRARLAATV